MLTEEERRRALAMIMQRQGLGDIFARPAPPVQATPSSPLPGTPLEVAVVAPQSEQAIAAPQQYDEMAPVRRAMAQPQAAAATGNAKMDAIMAAQQATQQRGAQNFMDIMAAAQMNPEEQAIIQERRARNEREQAELDKDKKGAAWRALAKAGFAMAQSNSPYFMQALATGMQAGVTGLDSEKAAAAEKRSRLQASNEDLRLSEIRGKQAAQDRAVSIYNAALAAGKGEAEAQRLARRDAEEQATLPQRMEAADLDIKGKKADIRLTEARIIDALRPPSSGGGGYDDGRNDGEGSPGKPLPPGARADAEGRLATAYAEQDEAYQNWVAAGKPLIGQVKTGGKDWLAASKYEAARGKVNNFLGTLGRPKLGAAPTRPAARKSAPAAAAKSAKPKGFQGTQAVWDVMTPAEKQLFQ